MKYKNILSVSIFIPAYNEEENISYLLESIIRQKQINYRIKKIAVISDGSTDKTEEKVLKFKEKFPIIELVADGKRKGKIERLNQIYKINTSEIIVVLDGDILLSDSLVIDRLVRKFVDSNTVIVGANKIPIKASNFVEMLVNYWYLTAYEMRKDMDEGDSIHNFSSCAFAIRNTFAKKIYYPKNVYPITKFTFLKAKTNNLDVKFAKDACVYFRSPSKIKDYLMQINRFHNVKDLNIKYYGKEINNLLDIPVIKKITTIIRMTIKHPLYVPIAIVFRFILALVPFNKDPENKIWKSVKSTKKLI